MELSRIYQLLVTGMVALAAVTLLALLVFPAPYGRHSRAGVGPSLSSRFGWFLMEAPASVVFAGMFINRAADSVLRRLRRDSAKAYAVPHGGLYRWVSCPNYLGEIIMWTGWAVATWSAAGLAFALYTAANLLPRAVAHHRWYRRQFPDYPAGRRALIPGFL